MSTGNVGLVSYLVRVLLALVVMGLAALFFVRTARSKGWAKQNGAPVQIMASLPLGKDVFFVLRCGPDVVALVTGRSGISIVGRWRYNEWVRLQAEETSENVQST